MCHGISLGVSSLAIYLNKRGSNLVTDQTPAAFCGLQAQVSSPHARVLCLAIHINLLKQYLAHHRFSSKKNILQHKWYKVSSATKSLSPSRRPRTSLPQSSLQLCAVFIKLVFSLSVVQLSGTLYFFLASAGLCL